MHNFDNYKIQELYNYLAEDFHEDDFFFNEESVIKEFESYIRILTRNDFIAFEQSIKEWDLGTLKILARLLGLLSSSKLDVFIIESMHLLAFINCDYDDALDVLVNLSFELSDL